MVVVGGGTGTFTVLRGLKELANGIDISAVVTMADDGGSNKILRDEFGLLPTSGIRQAIVALSADEGLMRELFTYRYYQGKGISGMTFGNLFMAALSDILKSQKNGIEETCELLQVKGQILPVSYDDVRLFAKYEDGTEVLGEHMIDDPSEKLAKQKIVEFRTVPSSKIDKEARSILESADLIVIGPGDLYTNTVANLVVEGVVDAIKNSKGKVVFVMNLMTKLGEAYEYKSSDFLDDLGRYLPLENVDYVLVNSDYDFDPFLLKAYKKEYAKPVEDDLSDFYKGIKVVREGVLSHSNIKKQKGDSMKRSMVRHDSNKLAKVLEELVEGKYDQ